jgi:hypothetical protein
MGRHGKNKVNWTSARKAAKVAATPSKCKHRWENLWTRNDPKDKRPWQQVEGWHRSCLNGCGTTQKKKKLDSGDKT